MSVEDWGVATVERGSGGRAVVKEREPDPDEVELANRIRSRIQSDKAARQGVFKSMEEDSYVARHGCPRNYPKDHYRANFINRHIQDRVSRLYAKNPSVRARIADQMNYEVWDEDPKTLELAFQILQAPAVPDPLTGQPVPPPGQERAFAIVQDFTRGQARASALTRTGKTLERLIQHYMSEPSPLNFKDSAKACVRRACTTKVAYVAVSFRREALEDFPVSQDISDSARRVSGVAALVTDDGVDSAAKLTEARYAYRGLQERVSGIIHEGIEFTYPESHRVIPDINCRSLVGFVGARWVTVEHPYTADQLYSTFGRRLSSDSARHTDAHGSNDRTDTILVWEHFDRLTGLVYVLCDGVSGFLQEPQTLPFEIDGFFPIFALTFNEIEDPSDCYPPSDVELMLPMQDAHNEARQAQRVHRDAAQPRYIAVRGALDDDDKERLASLRPHEVAEIGITNGTPINQVIQNVPVSGVDPNLYQVVEVYRDMTLAGGTSEAAMGGSGRSTATEAELAAASQQTSTGSNIDDIDSWLSRLFRACGQIALTCFTADRVREIVGPGAVWPTGGDAELTREIYLEVVGGSSGRPNQAADIANWTRMIPLLTQIPGMDPIALGKEALRRLDDKLDVNDLIVPGLLSIVQQNAIAPQGQLPADQAAAAGDPAANPMLQGPQGANHSPREQPGGAAGTAFPMGGAA